MKTIVINTNNTNINSIVINLDNSSIRSYLLGNGMNTSYNAFSNNDKSLIDTVCYELRVEDEVIFIYNGKLIVDYDFKGTTKVPYVFSTKGDVIWKEAKAYFGNSFKKIAELQDEEENKHNFFLRGIGQPRTGGYMIIGCWYEIH